VIGGAGRAARYAGQGEFGLGRRLPLGGGSTLRSCGPQRGNSIEESDFTPALHLVGRPINSHLWTRGVLCRTLRGMDSETREGNTPTNPSSAKSAKDKTLCSTMERLMPTLCPRDWWNWPPDMFALTSRILLRTGLYRLALDSPWPDGWPETEWDDKVRRMGREWARRSGSRSDVTSADPLRPATKQDGLDGLREDFNALVDKEGEGGFDSVCELAFGHQDQDIEWKDHPKDAEFIKTIIEIHATADAACLNLGIPISPASPDHDDDDLEPRTRFRLVASTLLAQSGSLSRLPLRHGTVLPKLRTAQVGVTLRSLSHNIAYDSSEVHVSWTATPWINDNEDTINILIVPWPYSVEPRWFKRQSFPQGRHLSGTGRSFSYNPEEDDGLAASVCSLLKEALKQTDRIHIIVLPEVAASEAAWDSIKTRLGQVDQTHPPMLIGGVRPKKTSISDPQKNTIRLSTQLGGKWYEISQHKHHKWKLDKSQIDQYGLGSVLSGEHNWWESIGVPRRSLSFVCANGWLTICPLICEDLARQDPIAQVVRNVGPTLVVAALFDGPQLKHRWPARYATIFSEDPGSSALTVTALGMARRSIGPNGNRSSVVALWRDSKSDAREISVDVPIESLDVDISDESKPAPPKSYGVLLSTSARWTEEYTLDGRSDRTGAAVLCYHGHQTIVASAENPQTHEESRTRQKETSEIQPIELELQPQQRKGASDLTQFVFAASSGILETCGERILTERIERNAACGYIEDPDTPSLTLGLLVMKRALGEARSSMSVSTTEEMPISRQRRFIHAVVNGSLRGVKHPPAALSDAISASDLPRFLSILDKTEEAEIVRLAGLAHRGLLWAAHSFLCGERYRGTLTHGGADIMQKIEKALLNPEALGS